MKDLGIIVHTDGGARGNPGPSACGFVVEDGGAIIFRGSKYLGINTNNYAEYSAFVIAMEWLNSNKEKLSKKDIHFFSDSELVVKQLSGLYKVKNEKLKVLNTRVQELSKNLGLKIFYKNILRDKNKDADELVNNELDRNS
jgi:ribonuclease HI